MGEIAEMMLDGILCEHCGALIDGEGTSYPRYCCEECAREAGALWEPEHKRKRRKKHKKNNKGEQNASN